MNDPKSILLIEDDVVDAMAVNRALMEMKIKNPVILAKNGEEGLDYLYSNIKNKPVIIFLDLNMPRMNGMEFLTIIKKAKEYKNIPIIVLTTSNEENDKQECLRLGAVSFIVKQVDYSAFLKSIISDVDFWMKKSNTY